MRMRKQRSNFNYDNINDFLKVAISDLAGNLTLLDTKISIIIATVGVILGLVVACKSNVLKAYYIYANNCCTKCMFLLLSLAYIVSVIITFIYGIKCIMIRFGKSKSSSLWFFDTELYGGLSEESYIKKIKCISDETIMNMASPSWSEEHFGTSKPFIRICKDKKIEIKDGNGYTRYWSEIFVFGKYDVLVSKEWYEKHFEKFELWYNTLQ